MEQQPTSAGKSAERDSCAAPQQNVTEVDATLAHLGHLCGRLEQAEQRFKQMTDECSSVLQRLVSVDRRHAITLATLNDRLGDWCNIERKLLEESASRIERFERGVEHEWTTLRRKHEEPIEGLRNEADKLRAACLDAARLVHARLEAADRDRLLQAQKLERRLAEWGERVVQATIRAAAHARDPRAEVNSQFQAEFGETAASVQAFPWPLDGVAQLHQELRTGRPRLAPPELPATGALTDPKDIATPGDGPPAATEAIGAAGVTSVPLQSRTNAQRRAWIRWAAFTLIIGVLCTVTIVAGVYIMQMQRRLMDLESKTTEAARQVKAPKADAPAITAAREAAERTRAMAEILAAPDLLRFALAGVGPGQGAYGQVLWSRSRGMALTVVGLRAPAAGVYRVWVIDSTRTAAAGNLTVDGTATPRLIVAGPLTLPRPTRITVTLEERSSQDVPSGPIWLARPVD